MDNNTDDLEQKPESLSQYQLIWRGFKKHRLAKFGLVVLFIFYFITLFSNFIAPYEPTERLGFQNAPPNRVRFFDEEGNFQRPFVYDLERERDMQTLELHYTLNKEEKHPIYFFVEGPEYKLMGLFSTNIHLFGPEDSNSMLLFGTDSLGRDLFSRVISGTRISTTIGLISVFLSLILGLLIGAFSALFGGVVDLIIQRIIEVFLTIPNIPLWMALSAALPEGWSPIAVYFAITIILALKNWILVARVVRGKFLSLKDEDFILAARSFNTSNFKIVVRHMIPNFLSYVIVNITVSIPGIILAETALSFLGIGLRPPIVSWGVLLQRAQNVHVVIDYPWLMIPGIFVVLIVLAFNFVGDGIRDAADPYSA